MLRRSTSLTAFLRTLHMKDSLWCFPANAGSIRSCTTQMVATARVERNDATAMGQKSLGVPILSPHFIDYQQQQHIKQVRQFCKKLNASEMLWASHVIGVMTAAAMHIQKHESFTCVRSDRSVPINMISTMPVP